MLESKYSFRLFSSRKITTARPDRTSEAQRPDFNGSESDNKKRSFLKLLGVVGAGVAASTLIPRKAEALVFGSTPTSNTVGVKNASNARVNPATQETLLAIKSQSDLLTFDSGSNPANLRVNVSAGVVGVKNVGGTTVNPATEDTLALMKAQTDKLTFDGSNNLLTATTGAASAVGLKDVAGTQVNPATDDSILYLRRMVKLMESQATVDGANRQRVNIDGFGTNGALVTGTGVSGAGVPRVTVASDSSFTITLAAGGNAIGSVGLTAGASVLIGAYDHRQFIDVARNAYANGIRNNLTFS